MHRNRSVITLYQTLRAARYLAISSKKSLCALKKNESRGAKVVDVQPGPARPFHVLDAVVERERQFLQRRRSRFANVVTADRNRVPLRHVLCAELERVDDELHRRPRRKDVGLLGDVFLEDVVLDRPAELVPRMLPAFPRPPDTWTRESSPGHSSSSTC